MTSLREIYYCEKCKNVIEILHEGANALVCCGLPMQRLEEKTEDTGNEKHVPVIEETNDGVLVKVGTVEHPMLENHFIKFIEVHTEDKIHIKFLKPGDKPEAFFKVKKDEINKVREYCNLHLLWKA